VTDLPVCVTVNFGGAHRLVERVSVVGKLRGERSEVFVPRLRGGRFRGVSRVRVLSL
jgi:hypothetical protein